MVGKGGAGAGIGAGGLVTEVGTVADALAAASFACKFWTFRFRDSTLVASFFFSFNILGDTSQFLINDKKAKRNSLKDTVIILLNFSAFSSKQFFHLIITFL